MSGIRWTTGIGIAVGGVGGAIAALLGAPKAPAPLAPVTPQAAVTSAVSQAPTAEPSMQPAPAVPSAAASSSAASPGALPSAAAGEPTPESAPSVASAASVPGLPPPTTREALHKAMLFCDQKRDFDECGRAAEALEKGTTAAPDPEQAKRFRRIALTHLVAQCEAGAPHACFVLAAKYRAGTELAANPATAQTLEKRGVDLCRLRDAPECPDRPRGASDAAPAGR